MKKLYLLFFIIICSASIKAQNWQTVYSDRVQYFDSSLKAIKIVSVKVNSNGDSTFKNYNEYLIDSFGRTENIYGKIVGSTSWIGRRVVVKKDGYNGFASDRLQWVWINTKANLNDTFTFFKDNKLHIQGICKNVFSKDTLGIQDSIKQFRFIYTLTRGYRFDFDTSSLNTFEILLSKYNGIIKTPSFRLFSFKWDGIWLKDLYLGGINEYSNKNYFTNRAFNTLGVGDEFEYETSNNYTRYNIYKNRYYYKVTKKDLLKGTDSIKYTFLVKAWRLHRQYTYNFNTGKDEWQDKITTSVNHSTRVLVVNDEPIRGLMPNELVEEKGSSTDKYFSRMIFWKFNNCNLKIEDRYYGIIEDTTSLIFRGPFEHAGGKDLHSKIGYLSWFLDGSTGSMHPVGERYNVTYQNFCLLYIGTPWVKYNVFGVGVEEVKTNKVNIYPNPVNDIITIETNGIKSIELIDLQGKKVLSKKLDNSLSSALDVSQIKEGFYIIKVISESNTNTQKVIISH